MKNRKKTGFARLVPKGSATGFNPRDVPATTPKALGRRMIAAQNETLTAAELEMLKWNQPVLKPNGKLEPPDVPYEYMLEVMKAARLQSGRLITDLDEFARIARRYGQRPNP